MLISKMLLTAKWLGVQKELLAIVFPCYITKTGMSASHRSGIFPLTKKITKARGGIARYEYLITKMNGKPKN
jgi:hypothetical protein